MQTNTHPTTTILSFVTDLLADSLNNAPPESIVDPRVNELLNSKAISMQLSVAEKLHDFAAKDAEDLSATTKLIRILSLLERTRSRVARSAPKPVPSEFTAQREDAHRFIEGELASGSRPVVEIIAAAKQLGIAQRTLMRAKSDLNVLSLHVQREDKSRCWMWSLAPAPSPETVPA